MSKELKDYISSLCSYYEAHNIENMIKTHPNFIADDFKTLLSRLSEELNIN